MKKALMVVGLIVSLGLLSAPAMAEEAAVDFDGSKPLICAAVNVVECLPGGKCQNVLAEEVDMPDFLRFNFKKKEIRAEMAGRENLKTDIEHIKKVDGKLILQGAEDGRKDRKDGLGWSMAIDQVSGKMVFSASGTDVAFVVFGACAVD